MQGFMHQCPTVTQGTDHIFKICKLSECKEQTGVQHNVWWPCPRSLLTIFNHSLLKFNDLRSFTAYFTGSLMSKRHFYVILKDYQYRSRWSLMGPIVYLVVSCKFSTWIDFLTFLFSQQRWMFTATNLSATISGIHFTSNAELVTLRRTLTTVVRLEVVRLL